VHVAADHSGAFSLFTASVTQKVDTVAAYPAETTEAFLDGHVSAFAFFGGVPLSVHYDTPVLGIALTVTVGLFPLLEILS